MLDELDLEIRRNFEHRGWLSLLDISHRPLAALIREFYTNLSIHSDDSNTHYVMSWIKCEENTITPSVVAFAFGIPLVRQPIYPYDETLSLDDIMSYLTSTSISGVLILVLLPMSLPRFIICFFGFLIILSGPSLTFMSYLCFLYANVTDAPMNFPTLFIRSLVEVHRSSSTAHSFFFSVFIHRILLHLGLQDFPASKLVHIIAPIGPTFLRQRTAQMKTSSKRPYVKSSSGAPPPPSSVDPTAEACVDSTTAVDPPPSASDDSSIRSMLDTVMTV